MKTNILTLTLIVTLCAAAGANDTNLSQTTLLGFKPGETMRTSLQNPIISGKSFKTTLDSDVAKELGYDQSTSTFTITPEQLAVYINACKPRVVKGCLFPAVGSYGDSSDQTYKFTENHPQLLGMPVAGLRLHFSYSYAQNEWFLIHISVELKRPDVPISTIQLFEEICANLRKELGRTTEYWQGRALWQEAKRLPRNEWEHGRALQTDPNSMSFDLYWTSLGAQFEKEGYALRDKILRENLTYKPEGSLR